MRSLSLIATLALTTLTTLPPITSFTPSLINIPTNIQHTCRSSSPFVLSSTSKSNVKIDHSNNLHTTSTDLHKSAKSAESFINALPITTITSPEGEETLPSPSSSSSSPRTKWIAAIAFVALSWGMNFPVTKLVTDASTAAATVPPGTFTFLRFALAGAMLSPTLFKAEDLGRTLRGGGEVGAYLALGYVSQAIGLQTETAGEAGFLCSLQVVFVTLVQAAGERRIGARAAASAALAVAGVAALEGESEI